MSVDTRSGPQRLRIKIRGVVQGVGFRPFVYRLATEMNLVGWVSNGTQGVFVEVEGDAQLLESFRHCLEQHAPPRAMIHHMDAEWLPLAGFSNFEIRQSDNDGCKTVLVMPDVATCPDCLQEVFDPEDRRFEYAFTNCTNCGPRYTIIDGLPYDRPLTTMNSFEMCPDCQAEYDNPLNRRFHAQPNACPTCGPRLELWNRFGEPLEIHKNALYVTARLIRHGLIIAVKGLGGFHLMADARNAEAVALLRERKRRQRKPFALMMPSMDHVRHFCEVSDCEAELLQSPEAPIVLLKRIDSHSELAEGVAPGNPYLGVMLPYTPLHHLLMQTLDFPVIATSGNLSDEPICIDEHDALERLHSIADAFLIHTRPIVRHVDDSIVRVIYGRPMILRRARGYAPLPVSVAREVPPTLAVGAHLKNTTAAAIGSSVFISQHIGDLASLEAYDAFRQTMRSFAHLYQFTPETIACDLHPDYFSSQYAAQSGLPVVKIQHHEAHILACMAEHHLNGPVLGISWDGTGLGTDGTIWGGEFLLVDNHDPQFERIGHLRTFPLPGGDQAAKEPRRSAIGLLYAVFGNQAFEMIDLPPQADFCSAERLVLHNMLKNGINTPLTSSAGRLFDAVSALLGICQQSDFEGDAAMQLEFAVDTSSTSESYPFTIDADGIIDWEPMLHSILRDRQDRLSVSQIAARFHLTLVEMMLAMAHQIGERRVVLSGGCFQNKFLTEQAIQRLQGNGFDVYWPQQVPPNDGGIALGQIIASIRT